MELLKNLLTEKKAEKEEKHGTKKLEKLKTKSKMIELNLIKWFITLHTNGLNDLKNF